jgi:hypothetical protein
MAMGELVPILIKVQRLQTRLIKSRDVFMAVWNHVDAFRARSASHGVVSFARR